MDRISRIPLPVMLLLCLDAMLVVVYLMDSRLGSPLASHTSQHDLGAVGNVPAWLASGKYLLAAGLVLLAVYSRIHRNNARSWALLALPTVLALLSCNAVANLRGIAGGENAPALSSASIAAMLERPSVWTLVIGVPIALGLLFTIFALSRAAFWKPSALWRFLIGCGVTLAGTLGMEALSRYIPGFSGSVQVAAESYLQMIGATVMLWAASDQARAELHDTIATQGTAAKASPVATSAVPSGVIRPDMPARDAA
jgi:hypothetical protein